MTKTAQEKRGKYTSAVKMIDKIRLVEEFLNGPKISQKEFAEKHKLKATTFSGWVSSYKEGSLKIEDASASSFRRHAPSY